MPRHHFLAALALGFGLAASAVGQAPLPRPVAAQPVPPDATAEVYKLRNVAAADAAQAVSTLMAQGKHNVTVVPEPVSNSVLVMGDVGLRQKVVGLLKELDKAVPAVVATLTILKVPAGFLKDVGLADGDEAKWVLTPREARMLTAAIRLSKGRDGLSVLSRPQLMLTDNQTGFFQIGDDANQVVARVTPRVAPDGKSTLLRLETQLAEVSATAIQAVEARAVNVQTVQTADSVPNGGTLVVRGPRSKAANSEAAELVIVMTVEPVASK